MRHISHLLLLTWHMTLMTTLEVEQTWMATLDALFFPIDLIPCSRTFRASKACRDCEPPRIINGRNNKGAEILCPNASSHTPHNRSALISTLSSSYQPKSHATSTGTTHHFSATKGTPIPSLLSISNGDSLFSSKGSLALGFLRPLGTPNARLNSPHHRFWLKVLNKRLNIGEMRYFATSENKMKDCEIDGMGREVE